MNILRIDASARHEDSNSRKVADYLVEQLGAASVTQRDLANHNFPTVTGDSVMAVYSGSDDPAFAEHLALSEELTGEVLAADTLVISSPIYNFSVPSYLKQWIDFVCRAGITFRYGENGPEGLSGIRTAYIVTASGGVPVGSPVDFASRYLEQVCRFIGVEDVHHIDAGGSKRDPEAVVSGAKTQIDNLLQDHAEVNVAAG